jgi:predicted ATP-grasp superfamily ATP-dependent carboligase
VGVLLLLGVSVRALAESAARGRMAAERFPGGLLCLDYFGDDDLRGLALRHPVRVLSLPRDLGRPRAIAALGRAALGLGWDAVAYAGGLENRPALLRRLARRGVILGNGPSEVGRVRDPRAFFAFLDRAGIPHPPTRFDARAPGAVPGLWKAARSGGGGRIRPAGPGERRPRGHYHQEYLPGPAGSAAFLAAGGRAVILGVTEQISGWRDLGGAGFRYGGNIAGPPEALLPPGALAALSDAASAIARRFGLRGLNGLDFVIASGTCRILEVNPRYTAAMELVEARLGQSLFDLHLLALDGGPLPPAPMEPPLPPAAADGPLPPAAGSASPPGRFLAKGILYAARPVIAPPPEALAALGCRDRPARGERIEAGHPVCTLVTAGESPAECRRTLADRAAAARRLLAPAPAQRPSRQALPAHRGSW